MGAGTAASASVVSRTAAATDVDDAPVSANGDDVGGLGSAAIAGVGSGGGSLGGGSGSPGRHPGGGGGAPNAGGGGAPGGGGGGRSKGRGCCAHACGDGHPMHSSSAAPANTWRNEAFNPRSLWPLREA